VTGALPSQTQAAAICTHEALVAVMNALGADSRGMWRAWFDTGRDGHLGVDNCHIEVV
jgi:hypothetical protein